MDASGTLLILAVYFLPGIVFLTTTRRYIFPGTRPHSHLTIQIFSFGLATLLLALLLDREGIHQIVICALERINDYSLVSSEYLSKFRETKISEILMKFAVKPTSLSIEDSPFVIKTLLLLSGFSFVVSLFIALLTKAGRGWETSNIAELISHCALLTQSFMLWFISFLVKAEGVLIVRTPPKAGRWIFTIQARIFAYIYSQYWVVTLLLGTLLLVILLCLLALIPVLMAIELLILPLRLFFGLFHHPWEKILREDFFGSGGKLRIVEIKDLDGILHKGVLSNYLPKNSEELLSVTIQNIIQYSKTDSNQKSFKDAYRSVYVFPNNKGKLTIPFSNIRDIHAWNLSTGSFKRSPFIGSIESIKNQIWYLDLVISKNKASFVLKNYAPSLELRFSPKFIIELLRLFKAHYSSKTLRLKLRTMLKDVAREFRFYNHEFRANLSRFNPTEQTEMSEDFKLARQLFGELNRETRAYSSPIRDVRLLIKQIKF